MSKSFRNIVDAPILVQEIAYNAVPCNMETDVGINTSSFFQFLEIIIYPCISRLDSISQFGWRRYVITLKNREYVFAWLIPFNDLFSRWHNQNAVLSVYLPHCPDASQIIANMDKVLRLKHSNVRESHTEQVEREHEIVSRPIDTAIRLNLIRDYFIYLFWSQVLLSYLLGFKSYLEKWVLLLWKISFSDSHPKNCPNACKVLASSIQVITIMSHQVLLISTQKGRCDFLEKNSFSISLQFIDDNRHSFISADFTKLLVILNHLPSIADKIFLGSSRVNLSFNQFLKERCSHNASFTDYFSFYFMAFSNNALYVFVYLSRFLSPFSYGLIFRVPVSLFYSNGEFYPFPYICMRYRKSELSFPVFSLCLSANVNTKACQCWYGLWYSFAPNYYNPITNSLKDVQPMYSLIVISNDKLTVNHSAPDHFQYPEISQCELISGFLHFMWYRKWYRFHFHESL